MKKLLRILGYVILLIIVSIGGFVTFIEIRGVPKYDAPTSIPEIKVEVTPERVATGEK